MDTGYKIIPYNTTCQPGIDALMESIYAEFEETIYGPGSKKTNELTTIPGRYYWVVLQQGTVVGTMGIALIANNIAVLKGMMLHKDHRGKEKRLSQQMLGVAEHNARSKGADKMYLGTMTQMKGAQRFYEQNGYMPVDENALPGDFPANPVDKVFYFKKL